MCILLGKLLLLYKKKKPLIYRTINFNPEILYLELNIIFDIFSFKIVLVLGEKKEKNLNIIL